MISSPCKNCPRKDLPKEDCAQDCQLLKAIQDIELSAEINSTSSGIDYSAENRYTIPLALTKTSAYLWTA